MRMFEKMYKYASQQLALAIVVTVAVGCTTKIVVNPLNTLPQAEGIVYYLPISRYEVNISREIVDCFAGVEYTESQFEDFINANPSLVKMNVKVEIEEIFAADVGSAYVWNYPTLDSPTKITTANVTLYENGTLKSVNATVDDQTAEIAANVIRGVATIAATSAGVPFDPGSQKMIAKDKKPVEKVNIPSFCTQKVLSSLETKRKSELSIKSINKEIELIQTGNTVPEQCRNTEGNDLEACLDLRIKELSVNIMIAEARVKLQLKTLIQKKTYLKVPVFRQCQTENHEKQCTLNPVWSSTITMDKEIKVAWFNVVDFLEHDKGEILKPLFQSQHDQLLLHMRAKLFGMEQATKTNIDKDKTTEGLVYRQPLDAHLRVFRNNFVNQSLDGEPVIETITEAVVQVPQAGIVSSLPLVNRAFDNNSLSASFAANGALTELKFTSQARAEEASKLFLESAAILQEFNEAKQSEELHQVQRRTALIEAETDLINAEKTREDAQQ